jgi:predicted lipid-binding transport protein (Tim44 family)
MQQAWDEADTARLRAMMTQEMADTVNERLLERAEQGPSPQAAEIVVLEARFLGMEQTQSQRIASVEFSGMVREAQAQAPAPFREIWDMTQSRDDAGACWLVAGVESLQ